MEVEPENVTGSYDAEATGTYRPCHGCQAPIRQPFPEDWTIEMIKQGPPTGPVRAFLTPHTAECTAPDANPQPGHVIRVPGRYVYDVAIDLRPPPAQHSPVRTDLWWDHPDMDPEGIRRDARTAARREAERAIEPTDLRPPLASRLGDLIARGQVYVAPLDSDFADLTGFTHIGHAEGWAVTDLTEGQAVQSVNADGQQFFKPVVPFAMNGHAEASFELATDEVPDWLTDLGKDDPCPPTEQ